MSPGRAFSYRDESLDPYRDDHYVDDWKEARERVETYIKELTSGR